MPSSLNESVASWASLISALFSVVGLVQSKPRLTVMSVLCLAISLLAGIYARRQHRVVESASVRIEGRSIDSLNLANLSRRINRTLVIQDVSRLVRITGQDLEITARYTGFCRANRETAIEFSLDSDSHIPFSELSCWAYDLRADPGGKHRIRPILISADGNSKKIAVPFLTPVQAQQPFEMLLTCTLKGCIKTGIEYYTAALSFDQESIPRSNVTLSFTDEIPSWMRVYEITPSGHTTLVRDLQPSGVDGSLHEYRDDAENVPGRSARVYLFLRAGTNKVEVDDCNDMLQTTEQPV